MYQATIVLVSLLNNIILIKVLNSDINYRRIIVLPEENVEIGPYYEYFQKFISF